ncbi:MAG TPA: universal stress protein [Bradyrhizobium sp.]|nr:universal stress protein [Bradyrhizobium sp.]
MIKKILVALDGSTQAGRALDLAIEMAGAFDAELVAIHVVSDQPLTEGERRLAETEYQSEIRQALSGPAFIVSPALTQTTAESLVKTSYDVGLAIRTAIGRQIVSRAEEEAKRKGVASVKTKLEDGDPATVIVEVAEKEKPDLLVIGSRGLRSAQELLMGSVSHNVSYSAKCTVVIVK